MAEWDTLFEGTFESCEALAEKVHDAGILVDRKTVQGPIVSKSGARETWFRVDVPPEDLAAAKAIRSSWEIGQADRARSHAASVYRSFALGLLLPAVWCGAAALDVPGTPAFRLDVGAIVAVIGFVLAAQLDR